MLKEIRQKIIELLWHDYCRSTTHVKQIEAALLANHIAPPVLDHFAIIDLPGPHTGITELSHIFNSIGYEFQGKDYLPEKQNDFTWMAESDSSGTPAQTVLPQVVVADFRLEELPPEVRNIVTKYSSQAKPSPAATVATLAAQAKLNNQQAAEKLFALMTQYLSGREWPLPKVCEFETVREYNELLAWVLVFGRRPNHFTYSIHLMPAFSSLAHFHEFVQHDVGLHLNHDGGVIKGSCTHGIEQGSTAGTPQQVQLADGTVELPMGFVEFVWRFADKQNPQFWNDYFTGFVANHANRVIQSLYSGSPH